MVRYYQFLLSTRFYGIGKMSALEKQADEYACQQFVRPFAGVDEVEPLLRRHDGRSAVQLSPDRHAEECVAAVLWRSQVRAEGVTAVEVSSVSEAFDDRRAVAAV